MSPLTLTADAEAATVHKDRIRAVVATLAGGIGITMVATSALDGFMRVRAVRARQRSGGARTPEPPPAVTSRELAGKGSDARVAVPSGR